MTQNHTLKITLSPSLAARIDEKIRAGHYVNASQLIEDSLESFLGPDDEFEAWLKLEVMPTIQKNDEDPSRFISAERVYDDLQEFMAQRRSKGGA